MTPNRSELAARIDHTALKPDVTPAQIEALCAEALEFGCAAVCVNGTFVRRVAERLEGSAVKACAVVGFPLGAMATEAKAIEAALAVADGAVEIDMVIPIGRLKAGEDHAVEADVAAIVAACAGGAIVKAILETSLLDDEQKARAAELAIAGGAAFVKTSTGFGGGGATVADVALLRKIAGTRAQVKASGGIRDRATALAMLAAGADRLGLSATAAVLAG